MKLLIGTPTANGDVRAEYMQSVMSLRDRIPSVWRPTAAALVGYQRNFLATFCLQGDYSHLLFVDSDVSFPPAVVIRMLGFDKPVVAAAYPQRALDLAAFHQAARKHEDPQKALGAALQYPVTLARPVTAEDDFVRAEDAPTGLMLIRRDVLERLAEAHPELHCAAPAGHLYANAGLTEAFQPFGQVYEANQALGEDTSFCRRWTALGGEIWVTFDERVGHTGPYTFRGKP